MPAQKRQAPLPSSVQDFDKRRAVFEAWLLERGSAVKQITNPYEVIRFMGVDAECIVYRKASGTISHWANGAAKAYRAFLDGAPWRATTRGKRDPKRVNLVLSLARRDGWACVFCGKPTEIETVTVEHFVPITAGAPATWRTCPWPTRNATPRHPTFRCGKRSSWWSATDARRPGAPNAL